MGKLQRGLVYVCVLVAVMAAGIWVVYAHDPPTAQEIDDRAPGEWWLWSMGHLDIVWRPLVPADSFLDCVERLLPAAPTYHWSREGGVRFKCEVRK